MSFKVSVIIPNYNHALFLTQRIQSVLNQSFQDFELILLDDCSTDNSQSIIAQYQHHPKVSHVVYNETNSGSPFKQWAKGVALAQGAYIWIAESDDFAEASFLERCVTQLDKYASVGLVYCDSNIIAHDLLQGSFKEKNKEYYPATDWTRDYFSPGMVEIERHLINNCRIYRCTNSIEASFTEIQRKSL